MGHFREIIGRVVARKKVEAGAFDQHGNKLDADGYIKTKNAGGPIYNSREEALDVRSSEGVETKKDNKSVFGGKRANLFGN